MPTQPVHGVPTQYGRACTSCARAKCRCIYRSDGSGCERCHRLKKDCTPSVSVRRRNVEVPSAPRRRRLEERLEDLVTILWEQASNNNAPDPSLQVPAVPPPISDVGALSNPHDSYMADSLYTATTSGPGVVFDVDTGMARLVTQSGNGMTGTAASSCVTDSVSALDIGENVADHQLRYFRGAYLPDFPLIHIPADMSSAALRQEKPFLWLVIMSVTTRSLATQVKLGDAVRKIVMQQVVMDEERSLDLLLGVLCFNAWSYYHKNERTPMVVWSQLAASLAFDLDIHRDVPGNDPHLYTQRTPHRPRRTLEERRAFLATYVVTSSYWLMYGKIESIGRTPYLADCIRILTQEKESDLDVLLLTHVRCHLVMDQATMCLSNRTQGIETSEGIPAYFVRALEGQLQDIRGDLPLEILQQRAVSLCLARTEVVVRSALIHSGGQQRNGNFPDVVRLQNLHSIVTSIQRWLHLYLEIPLQELMGLTTGTMTQLGHCIMVLFRLATLREPEWDTEEIKRRLNDLLESSARKLDEVPGQLRSTDEGVRERGGAVLKLPLLVSAVREILATELAKAETEISQVGNPGGETATYEPLLPSDISMDFAMEPWLYDMLFTS